MKEIIIDIKSASIVVENRSGRIFKNGLKTPICDLKNTQGTFVDCDTDESNMAYFENVSNLLHVLMGDRPVPSKKYTIRKRNSFIDNIVEQSTFIKELNVNRIEKEDKKGVSRVYIHKNYTQGKKCRPNSNMPTKTIGKDGISYKGTLTWDALVKRGYYTDGVNKVLKLLIDISKKMGIDDVRKEYTLIDFLYELRNDKYWAKKVIDFSTENDATYIAYVIQGSTKGGSINDISMQNSPNLAGLPVNTQQTPKLTSDFRIVLYVDNDVAEIIDKGVRCATFLDGGVAFVSSINTISDWENIEDIFEDNVDDGYIKASNLKRFHYDC